MNKLILVKYAPEIFLKGLNRNKFEKKLRDNIKYVLRGVSYEFIVDQNRWFIKGDDLEEIISRVKKVFGVSEVCIVSQVEREFDIIKEEALRVLKEINPATFKVETKRANKEFPMNSMEVSRSIGGYILSQCEDVKVDVKKPELFLQIEIRDKAYVYEKKIKAVGGLPYGMNGSTMLMLSGGIDSPVAAYMMARRGGSTMCILPQSSIYK